MIGHCSCLREECQKVITDGFLIKYFDLTGFRHVLCAAVLADFQSSWKICLLLEFLCQFSSCCADQKGKFQVFCSPRAEL